VAGSTDYPGALDAWTDKVDGVDTQHADDVNDAHARINAVQAELGTNPSGSAATVAARLATIEGSLGGGGAVSSVVGQTGAVTGTQILADSTVAAALAAKLSTSAASATYGRKFTPTSKTTTYTAAVGEFVLCDATSAAFTVTLPASPAAGDAVAVKKTDATANVVTVLAAGKTIDGDPNATIVSEDAGGVFTCDGTNWQVTSVMQTASAAAVTSVAGRAGAVVLAKADLVDSATLATAITPVSKTGTYTSSAAEFVRADATSAGFTVTLPSSPAAGAVVIVRKVDSTANVVTVAPAGGGTIDGDATASITSQWGGGTFMHVGSNVWLMTSVTGSRA
jgi:hypothetical protein